MNELIEKLHAQERQSQFNLECDRRMYFSMLLNDKPDAGLIDELSEMSRKLGYSSEDVRQHVELVNHARTAAEQIKAGSGLSPQIEQKMAELAEAQAAVRAATEAFANVRRAINDLTSRQDISRDAERRLRNLEREHPWIDSFNQVKFSHDSPQSPAAT